MTDEGVDSITKKNSVAEAYEYFNQFNSFD